ncbi:MAG: peptide chain release factor 1 [Clostridia bacterium]|nr:peptide chain release factor 1 [Clostridia bacterium]
MLQTTGKIRKRFDELTALVSQPEIIADNKRWKKLIKERNLIEEIAEMHLVLEKAVQEKEKTQELFNNEKEPEMRKFLEEELFSVNKEIEEIEEKIKLLLLPKDENDESNVIIEIRPAAGGDEAALFGRVLMNMYVRYAERQKWKVEFIDISETGLDGIKEATFAIRGKNAYKNLKFESGVHRVQRVPETESQGRVHTSTTTIAVLPEIEEVDFEILDKDIKIDTYRSSGAGGQHVNKTDSAIRITHLTTGIVVSCQDERSQIKNKERAMNVLKVKLYDYYKEKIDSEYRANRKSQVGTGDRSERIRTYNFPQTRVTDHRINYSIYSLDEFLDGNMQEMIDELLRADQKIKIENAKNN